MSHYRRPTWVRYAAAVALTAGALALKLLLVPLVTFDAPFLLFFAAVMAAAAFGGLGPGLLVIALAAIFNNYFFMAPYGRFSMTTDQAIRLLLFVAEGVFISLIFARLQLALRRAEENAAESRELERRILEISDAEQRRIGHDLHDGLGQHLTGIALMMRRLEQRLSAGGSPDAADATKVSQMTNNAVRLTHDLCRSLSPPALESAGLAEALRELAANAESVFDVRCTFEQNGAARPVALAAGVHLYRIAQEAISNAVRHGKARQVVITLDDAGMLRITDDGCGIAPATPAQVADGMGLRIMRYRAKMIGASIDIRPHAPRGTVVICRYPADVAVDRDHGGEGAGKTHAKNG